MPNELSVLITGASTGIGAMLRVVRPTRSSRFRVDLHLRRVDQLLKFGCSPFQDFPR